MTSSLIGPVPDSNASHVLSVLDSYPLTGHPARSLRPMPGATNAEVWLIDTPTRRYVLRCLSPSITPGQARFAATIQQHASTVLPQVPAIIINHDGAMVTERDGWRYLLTAHAQGTPDAFRSCVPGQDLSHELGHALGRLHGVLLKLPVPADAPRQIIPEDPTITLREAIAAHQDSDCPHHTVRRVLADKLRRATTLHAEDLVSFQALPATPIHGDVHPGNILVTGTTVTGIIDFDLARLAPRAYELIRALIYCLHPAGTITAYGPRAAAFLTGYLTSAPLNRHEIATMIRLYEITQILDPHGLATCHGSTADQQAFGHARHALSYWLRRNGPDITRLVLRTQAAIWRRRKPRPCP
jgi:homoserine kinase type II